jgi:inositol-pentakisphosphate 2-kinase
MHTHMRHVEEGGVADLPYCPLDLFSGTKERVTRAIVALWDTWESTGGKANNT